jgi:hypothetical protein
MLSLAHRNLFYDKIRLTVRRAAVVSAVVLITLQSGSATGCSTTPSNISDQAGADLRDAARGCWNLDQPPPFSERKCYRSLAVAAPLKKPGATHIGQSVEESEVGK